MEDYPKWKYHATKEALIVPDAAAEKALGDGWQDRPVLQRSPEPKPPPPPPEPLPPKPPEEPKPEPQPRITWRWRGDKPRDTPSEKSDP